MEICLRAKDEIVASSGGIEAVEKVGLKLDDLDLADSDREDYHNNVDILFVLDTTGSMGSYIEQSKTTIFKIVEKFSKMEFNIKFALCCYRDHPPQDSSYITSFNDLTNGKKLLEILNSTSAAGGGDGPEAVMDGLKVGLSTTSWRISEDGVTPSKRFVFHICDAPPHGEEFGGSSSDKSWQTNGCPCGTKTEDINKLLKEHKVDYHLIKATAILDKMEAIFKESFGENFAQPILLQANFSSASVTRASAPSASYKAAECEEELEDHEDECCEEDDAEEDRRLDVWGEDGDEEVGKKDIKKCVESKEEDEEEVEKEVEECEKEEKSKVKKSMKKSKERKVVVSKKKEEAVFMAASEKDSSGKYSNMWDGIVDALDKKLS